MKNLFTLLVFSLFFISFISAVECPLGEVNDTAPGDCTLYTDTNKDNLCDYSQDITAQTQVDLNELITGKNLKTKTVQEIATLYQIDVISFAKKLTQSINQEVKITDSFQLLHDNYGLSPDSAKEIAVALKLGQQTNIEAKEATKEYFTWQIFVILSALYFGSLYLVKKGKISVVKNRKFWNMLLLISFLITALTSIFVVLRLNYGITVSFPLNLVYWHIEIGLAMIVISIFHTLWHIPYLKSYFN